MTRLPQWPRLRTPSTSLPHQSPPNITTAEFRRRHAQTPARTTTDTTRVSHEQDTPMHAMHVLEQQTKNALQKAQERWHLYVSLTNKGNHYGHIPRVQGGRFWASRIHFSGLVSQALRREYTKYPSKTPAFPFLCSSWENWLRLTKSPNNCFQ